MTSMTSPTNHLPFITGLRAEADQFADKLTIVSGLTALGWLLWQAGSAFHFWSAPNLHITHCAAGVMGFYLVFRALAALIDYTIAAVFQALTDYLGGIFTAFNAPDVTIVVKDGPSNQRDSAVAYLNDLMKRPRQDTADVAGPAEPHPAA